MGLGRTAFYKQLGRNGLWNGRLFSMFLHIAAGDGVAVRALVFVADDLYGSIESALARNLGAGQGRDHHGETGLYQLTHGASLLNEGCCCAP
jgi:hypothetical protein